MNALLWFTAMVAAAAAGIVAEFALVARAAVEPGYEAPPANWFQAVIGLRLPIHVVVVHVRGNLPIILTLIATVLAIAVCGWRFAAALPRRHGAVSLVGAQVGIGLVLAAFPVTISSDPYAYMLLGRLWGEHGINPYANLHLLVPDDDPVLQRLAHFFGNPLPWADEYGPLFTQFAAAVSRWAGGLLGEQYLIYRLVAVLAAAMVSVALFRLLRNRSDVVRNIARFAFNPLVLLETAINGHNDILMVAFAAASFAVVEELPVLAGLLLGISIAVKVVSVVALPFLVAMSARRGIAHAAPLVLALVTVVVLAFRPFWVGLHTLGALAKGYQCFFSPSYLVNVILFGPSFEERANGVPFAFLHEVPVLRHSTWPQIVNLCFVALFVVGVAVLLARFIRRRRVEEFWKALVAFVWATPIFNPWYFVWLAPVTAWRGPWPGYVLCVTYATLAYYPVLYGIANGNFHGPLPFFVTVVAFVVPAIVLIVRHHWRNGTRGYAPLPVSR